MASFTVTQHKDQIALQTAELTLAFSLDDGGLRRLQRAGGSNLIGYGQPQPAIDVQVGLDSTWLADRVFVRHLRHTLHEDGAAVVLEIVIGIGPLMITDRYQITGTLIARTVTVHNVSEDTIRLRGLRLLVPWVRAGELESCRFEAPGSSVRPRVPLRVAAAQRRNVLPRRFFAPGLRFGRAFEQAPDASSGLLAVADPISQETLLCWYVGGTSPADPMVEGNDAAVTLAHEVNCAEPIAGDARMVV
ncbi:MAG: alpha-amylase, partial [Roseiflexaceae bacterium]|nr:alpha-amylase [Roseiflexaceae bacterium]